LQPTRGLRKLNAAIGQEEASGTDVASRNDFVRKGWSSGPRL